MKTETQDLEEKMKNNMRPNFFFKKKREMPTGSLITLFKNRFLFKKNKIKLYSS